MSQKFKLAFNVKDDTINYDAKQWAVARNGTECTGLGGPGSIVKLQWLIKNESDIKWIKNGCYLRNIEETEARGNPIFIADRLSPGDSATLMIEVKLPQDLKGYSRLNLKF